MYNITLICTNHKEHGKCNSNELYKIIERINPELIFEEIPPFRFDAYYKEQSISTLETNAIKKYSQNHKIGQCPVDDYDLTKIDKKDIDCMKRFNTIFNNNIEYNSLAEERDFWTYQHGFMFLNSKQCDELFDRLLIIEETIIKNINDEYLSYVFKLFDELMNNRENKMISNIYNYSKEHSYDKAIFTVGAGHRKSIIKKIEKYETQEKIKLNWMLYNN